MLCVYPRCEGTLTTGAGSGHCTLCRNPVRPCRACDSWNRAEAAFCRICGGGLPEDGGEVALLDPHVLEHPPATTRTDQPIPTAPQPRHGFLWALGEQGSLFRINPHADGGRQIEVRTRFWAGRETHAFALRPMQQMAGSSLTETDALVATARRLQAWGIVSQRTHGFDALEDGEEILCDARDAYQMVEGEGASMFALTRTGGQVRLLAADLFAGKAERFALPAGEGPVCGPVAVQGKVLVWTANALWTLVDGKLEREPLASGVTLWTAPSDDGRMRLPLGRSPAMVHGSGVFLPAQQYGAPALLHAQRLATRWSLSVIPVTQDGVLTETADGQPLLCSSRQLLVSTGGPFQAVHAEEQLSSRFAAFHSSALSMFFCVANYGSGTQHWLRARAGGADRRVEWALEPGQTLKDCGGFWATGGSMTTQILTEDQFARTEFVSWRV